MLHKDVLTLLMPVILAGDFATDLAVDGAALDRARADLETLRQRIVSDTATLSPPANDQIKMTPVRWDIKKPFYVALAAAIGFTIRFEDYVPLMAGWIYAGDEVLYEPWMDFNAGVSNAGDTLSQEDTILPWIWKVVVQPQPPVLPSPYTNSDLEALLNDLKPAHIMLVFEYLPGGPL